MDGIMVVESTSVCMVVESTSAWPPVDLSCAEKDEQEIPIIERNQRGWGPAIMPSSISGTASLHLFT